MANMSYCRFENTLRDLRDCYNNMGNGDLSKSEFFARKQMIEMCINIVERYDELVNEEFEEEEVEGMFIDDEEWEKENGR